MLSLSLEPRHADARELAEVGHQAVVFGHQGNNGGHISAHAVTGHRQSSAVDADLVAVGGYPRSRCISLIDGDRIVRLGRAIVLDEYGGRARSRHELAHETFVRRKVAEHPPSAGEEHERPKRARRADWAYDHEPHGLPVARDGPSGNVRAW